VASAPTLAHDTWFGPAAGAPTERTLLALGTGNRFPVQESGIDAAYLQQRGCRTRSGEGVALEALRNEPTALLLRAEVGQRSADATLSCWAQLTPFEVEITSEKVTVYLKEINPPQAVRDAWASLQQRGIGWKERYTKHARVEIAGTRSEAAAQPVGMGMDILLENNSLPVRAGEMMSFRVLRDGTALPNFAVELRGDLSPIGFWHRTDAQGRVSMRAPLAGNWVLRGTDLRLSGTVADTWESRFVTLSFAIAGAAAVAN
jgi:hypothetical protein